MYTRVDAQEVTVSRVMRNATALLPLFVHPPISSNRFHFVLYRGNNSNHHRSVRRISIISVT